MDIAKIKKHACRLTVTVVILVACAWLIPSQMGLAVAPGEDLHVKVHVLDSVGSRIGRPAFSAAALHSFNQSLSQNITRVATNGLDRLASGAVAPVEPGVAQAIIITTIKI